MSRPILYQLSAALSLTVALSAQQVGSISGFVFDKDFAVPLEGATVQVLETGARTVTNDQGGFRIPQLRPGSYTVVVSREGYQSQPANAVVARGRVTEVRVDLLGDFTELEEFVVQEALNLDTSSESALISYRDESAAMVDFIGSEMMSQANASDASDALKLVSGASTQNGKSAVIRGLPDRYVASVMNGVLLPSSDEDKRAIELDQFPASVIESLQVAKTFTPDQQGNASGGAVNIVLRGVPEEPLFFNWKVGTSYNSQVTGRGDFLTYEDGGVHGFGKSGGERAIQEEGENWEGAVGSQFGEAPDNFKWSSSFGGRVDLGGGWRAGGLANLFYDRSASQYKNGRDETRTLPSIGSLMVPQIVQGQVQAGPPYITSLLSIDRSVQDVSWGGLVTAGIANDDHAITGSLLFTRSATDTVIVAEDTAGKQYFFPGYDPENPLSPGYVDEDAAPYTRQTTLAYVERGTESLQLNGRHRFDLYGYGPLRGVEVDWTVARSSASRNTPDRREFGVTWADGTYRPLKPAAEFTLGNLQRTFISIEEDSDELAANFKLPIEFVGGRKGYLKFGYFRDDLTRAFRQQTFSNFAVIGGAQTPPTSFDAPFTGGLDWSDSWQGEFHPVTGADVDVDYDATQLIEATYLMAEVPLSDSIRFVTGVRWEGSRVGVTVSPEENAAWVPPFAADGLPNSGAAKFPVLDPNDPNYDAEAAAEVNPRIRRDYALPSAAVIWDVSSTVTLRGSYAETVARQTFKELSPVFQQEYVGGPVFVGDPTLDNAEVRNWDARVDWLPTDGSLFSVSYFKKFVANPIEYIEVNLPFSATKPTNYPRGTLSGWEVELRQDMGPLLEPLTGLTVGGNATWIDSSVRIPQKELERFVLFQGVLPQTSRDMTAAPDYLWNTFLTYDIALTGTSLGAFYTVTGDTLLQGRGPGDVGITPETYDRRYDNLSVTLRQQLGRGVQLSLSAQNLTDAKRRQLYRSEFLPEDVTRREYRSGVSYSLSISGVVRF